MAQSESNFSLESKLTEIRSIVEQMQEGALNFDKQIELFQKGTKLIQTCQKYLDESEMEIKKIVAGAKSEEG